MEAVGLGVGVGRARRLLDRAALVSVILASVAVIALAVAMAVGLRPLVVRSGSMSPAIDTGDIVLSKLTPASSVGIGDVVTFRDPSRAGVLVTHRVIRARSDGASVAFVTKGDANTGVERWGISVDGTVGRVVFRIPRAGYVLTVLGIPPVRFALVVLAGAILGVAAMRRIWAG